MSKLLTALLAAGFGLSLNAATAQDVKSDQSMSGMSDDSGGRQTDKRITPN